MSVPSLKLVLIAVALTVATATAVENDYHDDSWLEKTDMAAHREKHPEGIERQKEAKAKTTARINAAKRMGEKGREAAVKGGNAAIEAARRHGKAAMKAGASFKNKMVCAMQSRLIGNDGKVKNGKWQFPKMPKITMPKAFPKVLKMPWFKKNDGGMPKRLATPTEGPLRPAGEAPQKMRKPNPNWHEDEDEEEHDHEAEEEHEEEPIRGLFRGLSRRKHAVEEGPREEEEHPEEEKEHHEQEEHSEEEEHPEEEEENSEGEEHHEEDEHQEDEDEWHDLDEHHFGRRLLGKKKTTPTPTPKPTPKPPPPPADSAPNAPDGLIKIAKVIQNGEMDERQHKSKFQKCCNANHACRTKVKQSIVQSKNKILMEFLSRSGRHLLGGKKAQTSPERLKQMMKGKSLENTAQAVGKALHVAQRKKDEAETKLLRGVMDLLKKAMGQVAECLKAQNIPYPKGPYGLGHC